MAKWVFDRMLDRYDWMMEKYILSVPGLDEVWGWGGEEGHLAWYFIRSGNQALVFYYEGNMEQSALLALVAEKLETAT